MSDDDLDGMRLAAFALIVFAFALVVIMGWIIIAGDTERTYSCTEIMLQKAHHTERAFRCE